MAFEDPSKLKIDLVIEPESSAPDLDSDGIGADTPVSEPTVATPSDAASAAAALSAATASTTVQSADTSLTPWKKRFANVPQNDSATKTWQHRARSLGFTIIDRGTVWLSIVTVVTGLAVLGAVAVRNDASSCGANSYLYAPVLIGFFLYPLFIVRLLLMINSLRQPKHYLTFLRAIVPAAIVNTITSWGLMLALAAIVVAHAFGFVKSLEHSLSHQHMGQAMAVFTLTAAGSMQVLLVMLIIVSMVVFQKLFQWMEKRASAISGVAFGEKKAGLLGVIVGATIGLCGLYTSLSVGGEHPAQIFAISSLIWSIGILLASLFFSSLNKILQNRS